MPERQWGDIDHIALISRSKLKELKITTGCGVKLMGNRKRTTICFPNSINTSTDNFDESNGIKISKVARNNLRVEIGDVI